MREKSPPSSSALQWILLMKFRCGRHWLIWII